MSHMVHYIRRDESYVTFRFMFSTEARQLPEKVPTLSSCLSISTLNTLSTVASSLEKKTDDDDYDTDIPPEVISRVESKIL